MDSRSKNGARNIMAGFINRIVLMILPFISRTIIMYTLGSEYLGLGGLFTSILTVLNLSELGFGSALVYSMYKPVADGDKKTICAYLKLYKTIYKWIGVAVLIGGLAFAPFLPLIIKSDLPSGVNLYVIYLIFIVDTVISYFAFAYKKALLIAYQRSDIISSVNTTLGITASVLQIGILLIIPNYYYYVLVLPIITLMDNLWTNYITNKRYPDIQHSGSLSDEQKSKIKQHVKGIALQKACSTSRNTFANIIISMFLGLTTIAKYGNYYYIMNALHALLYQIPNAIRATVGNSVASESVEKNYNDFNAMYILYMWIAGWCTTCMVCLFQPFMELWMGKEMMFPMSTVILVCIYFVLLSLSDIMSLYKDGAGLWWQGRYRVVVEAVSNLILSFLFGWLWGVNGILLAPIITITFIGHIYGGYIVFHYYFTTKNFMKFIGNQVSIILIIAIVSAATYLLLRLIPLVGAMRLIIYPLIMLTVTNALYWLLFRLHPHYKESIWFAKNIVTTIRKK